MNTFMRNVTSGPSGFARFRRLLTVFTGLILSMYMGAQPYYVSVAAGDDHNSGSVSDPWATIQYAAEKVEAGDTVFIREGIYRERIVVEASGAPGKYITFRNYPGEQVNVWFSKNLGDPAAWYHQGGNLWYTAEGSFHREINYDVATIWHDGTSHWSYKKRDPALLEKQWDFWHNLSAGRLEVYSTANPATLAREIEVPLDPNDMNQFVLSCYGSYIVFDGIRIKYCNVHGMTVRPGAHHVIFRNGAITHGGGGNVHPYYSPPVRWGDALDVTNSVHDVIFEHSVFGEFPDGTLTNQGAKGVQYNIWFRNNYIYNSTNGIHCWMGKGKTGPGDSLSLSHIYFENNTFENIGRGWFADRGVMQGAIDIRPRKDVYTGDFYVRGNVFINCGTTRYKPGNRRGVNAAMNIWGGDITIENNIIYDGPSEGIHINGKHRPFTGRVANNLIYNNAWSGIHVMPGATDGSAEFYNNTLVNNGDYDTIPNILIESAGGDRWRNNIFYSSQLNATRVEGGDLDYNCYWPDPGPGPHSINLNPLFYSIEKNEYALMEESPCIDAGTSQNAPSRDLDDNARPEGRAVDMGALEWQPRETGNGRDAAAGLVEIPLLQGEKLWSGVIVEGELMVDDDFYIYWARRNRELWGARVRLEMKE